MNQIDSRFILSWNDIEIVTVEEDSILKQQTSAITLKGGSGSGNFGHAGRPGDVGGSAISGNSIVPDMEEEKNFVGAGWNGLSGLLQGWAVAEESDDSRVEVVRMGADRVFNDKDPEKPLYYDRLIEYYKLDQDEFEDSIRKEYEYTQSKLKKEYPDGYVTLYRALHNVYDEDVYPLEGKVSLTEKSLSSWSSSREGADKAIEYWGRKMGYRLLKTIIPIKNIFVYPNSCSAMRRQGEGEFVVIGRGNSVDVNIVDSEAYKEIIVEKQQTSAITLKGGSGSGNFGHAGRPGEVGGSQSGVDYHFTGISSHAQSRLTYDRNGQLNKIGDIIDELPLTHTMIDYIGDIDIDVRPDLGTYVGGSFGKTIQFSSRLIDGKYPDSLSLQYLYAPTTLHGVVSHELGHHMQRRMPMEDRISWDNLVEDRELFESFSHNRLPDVNPEFPTSMRSVELFAEAFSKYLWNPQSLPIRILDYMDSTLGDKIVEEKQLPISEVSKQNLIKIRTNMFADEVNALAERMFTGDVTLGSWEEAMKKMIRELHTSTAAIGKGGWDQMTPADWGRLGPVLKGQYKYLHGFAQYVEENKDTVSLKAIQARARMYGNAGAFSSIVVQAGDVISKKLPWLPKDGSTECLVNCKCFWKLDIVGTEVMKGGEGSGNFGHAGREGEVGGSAPTGGSISYAEKAKDYQISNTSQMERDPFAGIQRGFITEEGILLDAKKYSHEKFADEILNVDANAVSDQNREWLDKLGLEQIDNPEVTAIMDGLTRIHILRDEIAITTKLMDTPTLHRIQKYFTSGIIKRPLDSSVSWSGYLFNYPVDVNPATVSTGIHMTWREFIAMDKVGYNARDNQIILRESVEEYIEKQLPTGDWVDVQCVWHLRPAEHCKTCVGRNNHVELIRVHRTVPIPSVIG